MLILAPWNYPLNLMLVPLVGAIAAGESRAALPGPRATHRAKEDLRGLVTVLLSGACLWPVWSWNCHVVNFLTRFSSGKQ